MKTIEQTIQEIMDLNVNELEKIDSMIKYVNIIAEKNYNKGKLDALHDVTEMLNIDTGGSLMNKYDIAYSQFVTKSSKDPEVIIFTDSEYEKLKRELKKDKIGVIKFSDVVLQVKIDNSIEGDFKIT